jgi:hypothetical protein
VPCYGGGAMKVSNRFLLKAAFFAMATALLFASGCSLLLMSQFKQRSGTGSGTGTGGGSGEEAGSGFTQYAIENETVTVAWDPPAGDVASYKLFYRVHESGTWTLVTEIPAQSDPSVTLSHTDFGNGSFDFGVVAVADGGAESPMHTSLDNTAQPTSGWYLIWNL